MAKSLVVAYQGVSGAYSHIAATYLFPQATIKGYKSFSEAFEQVKNKGADKAVLPIENSIAGSVVEVEDLLLEYKLPIVAEVDLQVSHQLLVLPQVTSVDQIKYVHSHPKALEQCREFFRRHPKIKPVAEFDTAGSAELVVKKHDPQHAAIASREAGILWGLKSLTNTIQSNPHNYTRFVVIGRTAGEQTAGKTSMVFTIPHVAGSLVDALVVFKSNNLSMTKIESRPILGHPWEYRFFVDIENNSSVERALLKLKQLTTSLTILGSYPKGITITEN